MVSHSRSEGQDAYPVALVYPQTGSAGMFGLSCASSAAVAARLINSRGGLMGGEVQLLSIDAASGPVTVTNQVNRLIRAGAVNAVVGWQTSDVRRALSRSIQQRVPYIYTALYEGGERTDGVFVTGETPGRQLWPAMRWMRDHLDVRRWAIVGSRYVWPLDTAMKCRGFAMELGVEIEQQHFCRVGATDFDWVLRHLEQSSCQGVLMLLLGEDAVHFNRAFSQSGLDQKMVRLSSLMDENMLLASGPDATREVYSTAGYFETLNTSAAKEFTDEYAAAFGTAACLPTTMGESCAEGMLLLEALVNTARSTDVSSILATDRPVHFDGPRGTRQLVESHATQAVYLARAEACDFAVVETL